MNNQSLDGTQRKIVVNLFRYSLWADSMRKNFERVHARDTTEISHQLETGKIYFNKKLLESEMYLCMWFGTLYIVIEGWPRLRIIDEKLAHLLRFPYKKLLKNFRNATFHPEDYDDDRIKELMATGQPSIEWARDVTMRFINVFEAILLKGEYYDDHKINS